MHLDKEGYETTTARAPIIQSVGLYHGRVSELKFPPTATYEVWLISLEIMIGLKFKGEKASLWLGDYNIGQQNPSFQTMMTNEKKKKEI